MLVRNPVSSFSTKTSRELKGNKLNITYEIIESNSWMPGISAEGIGKKFKN